MLRRTDRTTGILPRGRVHFSVIRWAGEYSLPLNRSTQDADRSVSVQRTDMQVAFPLLAELDRMLRATEAAPEARLFASLQFSAESALRDPDDRPLIPCRCGLSGGLRELVDRVAEDPSQDWTLRTAAKVAGYSQFHLSRTFRLEVGLGFPDFVERCRIQHFLHRTAVCDHNWESAAREVGYPSSTSFRGALRTVLGVLPSELKRMSARG